MLSSGEFPIPIIPDDFEAYVQSWLWSNGSLTDLGLEFHHKRSSKLNMMWDEEMVPEAGDPMSLDTQLLTITNVTGRYRLTWDEESDTCYKL